VQLALQPAAARRPSPSDFQALWSTLAFDSDTLSLALDATFEPKRPGPDSAERRAAANLPRLEDGSAGSAEIAVGAVLGQGGMGVVREATQVSLQRPVAVKSIRAEQRSPEATASLLREARITGRLEHPSIIPVHALGQGEDGALLLVMKRIEGTAWRDLLQNEALPLQGPALDRHLAILLQVCNAVHFAHSRGVVHRDLKPENVMVGHFGEVYVLDWGVAVELQAAQKAELGIAGTPGYMAPEMVQGTAHVGVFTDVYLLGGLLHTVLTGRTRHDGTDLYATLFAAYRSEPHAYDASVPAELADLCNRATAHDAADRPASAEAFRLEIEAFRLHHSSTVLAAEATGRLTQLRDLLAAEAHEAPSGAESEPDAELAGLVYHLYGESRFGFQQALRIWPDNRIALAGLHDGLEHMARFEIARGNLQAAQLFCHDLQAGGSHALPSDLHKDLTHLQARRHDEHRELAKLKHLERDLDFEVGSRMRSEFAIGLAVLSAVLPASFGWLTRQGLYTVGHGGYFLSAVAFAVFTGLAVWLGRADLLQNKVNRSYVRSLVVASAGLLAHRALVWVQGASIEAGLAQDLALFAVVLGGMAATIDKRLGWGAAVFLVASGLAGFFPEYAYFCAAAGNAIALGWVAMVWQPRGVCALEQRLAQQKLARLEARAARCGEVLFGAPARR